MSKSLWDSDESEAEGAGNRHDSDSEYAPSLEGGDYCRRSKRNVVNKYVSSSAGEREAAVLKELDAGLGVSSWGRLRKRRIIPNNIEDQGMSSSAKQSLWLRLSTGACQSRFTVIIVVCISQSSSCCCVIVQQIIPSYAWIKKHG